MGIQVSSLERCQTQAAPALQANPMFTEKLSLHWRKQGPSKRILLPKQFVNALYGSKRVGHWIYETVDLIWLLVWIYV